MFLLESPHRGGSNEYTQHTCTVINIKGKIILNYPHIIKSAAVDFFYGLSNEFEIAVVNEPSVFEPLEFYCNDSMVEIATFFPKHKLISLLFSLISLSLYMYV